MDTQMFNRGSGAWYDAQEGEEPKQHHWLLLGGVGGAAVMGMAFVVGFLGGQAPIDGLKEKQVQLTHQLHAARQGEQRLADNQRCAPFDPQINTVQTLISRGKPEVAASLASLYLHDTAHPPCVQTRLTLGELTYTARMDALFAQPPSSPLDHHPLLTWLSIERDADQEGIPAGNRLSPLTVAVQAYNAQLWELAHAAFLRAWQEQLVGPTNVDQVAFYYAVLRNQGRALVQTDDPVARQEGLQLLGTADAIAQTYRLGRGEAHADLVALLGKAYRAWPTADSRDPVLHGGKR